MKVHFICRGNALRSVLAEAYMKSYALSDVKVISSGTVADAFRTINEPTLVTTNELLTRHGLEAFGKNRADQLTTQNLHGSDFIICMNSLVYDEGEKIVTFPKHTLVWNIVDAGEGDRIIQPGELHTKYDEAIFTDIKLHVDSLVQELRKARQ